MKSTPGTDERLQMEYMCGTLAGLPDNGYLYSAFDNSYSWSAVPASLLSIDSDSLDKLKFTDYSGTDRHLPDGYRASVTVLQQYHLWRLMENDPVKDWRLVTPEEITTFRCGAFYLAYASVP